MKKCYYTDSILEICKEKHLTVEDIFKEISIIFPSAGKSSIYRNVENLVQSWNLNKIVWIWKKAYFEKNLTQHIHLIDNTTWNIIDLDLDLDKYILIKNLPENFKVSNYDIKIFWDFKNTK